jgi:hypothetical protein
MNLWPFLEVDSSVEQSQDDDLMPGYSPPEEVDEFEAEET